ncbi:MAG: tetratricopeptide repeat protein [Myxococcales bacterium]|nr:tetratricopeptide repeat protein [Myxococcales bacterium]
MLILALSLVLSAEPTTAIEWFQRGRAELKEGRPADALKSFERSQLLEPGLGTLLNIADCQERLGREVEAWTLFNEGLTWAKRTREYDRVELAQSRLKALDQRVGRVEVLAPADVTVTLNGQPVAAGAVVAVREGPVRVVAVSPGSTTWEATLDVATGQRLVIAVPAARPSPVPVQVTQAPAPSPAPVPEVKQAASPPGQPKPSRAGPLVLIGAGAVIAIAGGSLLVAGLGARQTWNDEAARGIPQEQRSVPASTFELTRWGVPAVAIAAGVGLLAVAGGLFWLFRSPEPPEQSGLVVNPIFFSDGMGISLSFNVLR